MKYDRITSFTYTQVGETPHVGCLEFRGLQVMSIVCTTWIRFQQLDQIWISICYLKRLSIKTKNQKKKKKKKGVQTSEGI